MQYKVVIQNSAKTATILTGGQTSRINKTIVLSLNELYNYLSINS
jgi:hypothetical protein